MIMHKMITQYINRKQNYTTEDLTATDVDDKLTQFALVSARREQQNRLTLIAYQLSNLKLFKVDREPVKCRLFWHQSCAHSKHKV